MKRQLRFILIWLFNLIYNLIPFFIFKKIFLKLFGIYLGDSSTIHTPVRLFTYRGGLRIGKHCTINPRCYLDNRGGIVIGSNVNISHDVKIYTAGHDVTSCDMKYYERMVVIKDDVWVFPNVLIMPGVTIGKGSLIYPGTVVTKSVPQYSIVAGNPSKIIKSRRKDLDYKIQLNEWFVF